MQTYVLKNINNFYKKINFIHKVLLFVAVLLILIHHFNKKYNIYIRHSDFSTEGFQSEEYFLITKRNNEIYDDFYSSVYDLLYYNYPKINFEINSIIKTINLYSSNTDLGVFNENRLMLVINSRTGYYLKEIISHKINTIGIEESTQMLQKSKNITSSDPNNSKLKFKETNIMDFNQPNFPTSDNLYFGNITDILCLNYQIYFIQNKESFFEKTFDLILNGGYLVIHLVDINYFKNLISNSNPLSKNDDGIIQIQFEEFEYTSTITFDSSDNNYEIYGNSNSTFEEKITFNNGKIRKHEQELFINDIDTITNTALESGFILHNTISLEEFDKGHSLYFFKKMVHNVHGSTY